MTKTASTRKNRSEAILQQEGVPYLASLVPLDDSKLQRSAETIATRAMATCLIASLSSGMPFDQFIRLSEQYHLNQIYSPQEIAFINQDESLPDNIGTMLTWRYESYWALLWILGYITDLERPDHPCDVEQAIYVMRARTAAEFVQQSSVRPITEILDAADLTLRYHWAVQTALDQGEAAPSGLLPGVVYERHHTFFWLLNASKSWDEDHTNKYGLQGF